MIDFLLFLGNFILSSLSSIFDLVRFLVTLPTLFFSFIVGLPAFYVLGFSVLFTFIVIVVIIKVKSSLS